MKMTESPVLNKVLDDNAYVGIPLSQESTTSDSSPSLLVPKSNNLTNVSSSESFISYVRYGELITFVSGAVIGVTIRSVINLGYVIISVLLDRQFGYFTSMLLLCAHVLFAFVLWAFFKRRHPKELRDSLVAVSSKNIAQLGLGFGFLGMQVLTGIIYDLSAGYVTCVVLWQAPFLLLYYNKRSMKGANNSQS